MRRSLGFTALAAPFALVAALTACSGGNDDQIAQSTVRIEPTNYVTQPVVTLAPSTTTIPGQTLPPGATTAEEQVYVVRAGDALPLIADRYGITVQDLVSYNDWNDGARHPIFPGEEVKIPPHAEVPGEDGDDGDSDNGDALDELGSLPEPNGAPLCPDGTQREVYEVDSGDYQGRVANELELPLEELAAANEGNPAWDSFIPGQNLWLPCEGEDLDSAPATTEDG